MEATTHRVRSNSATVVRSNRSRARSRRAGEVAERPWGAPWQVRWITAATRSLVIRRCRIPRGSASCAEVAACSCSGSLRSPCWRLPARRRTCRARSRCAIHRYPSREDSAASPDSDAGLAAVSRRAARRKRKRFANARAARGCVLPAIPSVATRSAWQTPAATRKATRFATTSRRRTGIASATATAPSGPASRSVKDARRRSPAKEPCAARYPKVIACIVAAAAHASPVRFTVRRAADRDVHETCGKRRAPLTWRRSAPTRAVPDRAGTATRCMRHRVSHAARDLTTDRCRECVVGRCRCRSSTHTCGRSRTCWCRTRSGGTAPDWRVQRRRRRPGTPACNRPGRWWGR